MSTAVVAEALSPEVARSLTDEVRADAEALWFKLLRLYEGGAHLALGYSSWGAYFEREFGGSKRRGYQLLKSANVAKVVEGATSEPRFTERHARELAPLLDRPEELREAWAEASSNGEPTARGVRGAVRARTRPGVSDEDALELIEQFYKGVRAISYVMSVGTKEAWARADRTDRKEVIASANDMRNQLQQLVAFIRGV